MGTSLLAKSLRSASLPGVLAAGACLAALSGCASYVPFTQELRDQHHLQTADLKNLQFYNSHTITLRREVERGGREVTGGHKLLVIAGKQIEEVEIPEHTPGVVVGADEASLEVSFDEGTSFRFRLHGPDPVQDPVVLTGGGFATPPDPFPGNTTRKDEEPRRHFLGSGNFWLTENGQITFQGKTWDAIKDSMNAHLVISTESLEEVEEQKTVLKGRKL